MKTAARSRFEIWALYAVLLVAVVDTALGAGRIDTAVADSTPALTGNPRLVSTPLPAQGRAAFFVD